MNSNGFIVIVLLLFVRKQTTGLILNATTAEFIETSTITKIKFEGIQKWTELGLYLFEVSVSADSKALMEAVTKLSGAIPYLGPILGELLDLVLGSDKFEAIREELHKMDSHLFAIENKIDALSRLIKDSFILSYYKSYAERINLIEMTYKQYMNKNTSINMRELISQCLRNNIMDYVYYVHRELRDSSSILSLMMVMKDNYNLANFQIWMKMLTGSIAQAMMLRTICLFAQYSNEPDVNDTMDGDISFFASMSSLLLKVVKEGTADIKQNFFWCAKLEINALARIHWNSDHTTFVQVVYNYLTTKYYFRSWFVASYDDEQWGCDKHYIASLNTYGYTSFRQYGRNFHVVHTNNNNNNIANDVKKILDSRNWEIYVPQRCKYVLEYIDARIGRRNSLGVVSFESDFSAKFSKGIGGVFFVESMNHGYKEGFNVFVVAGEIY